MACSQPKPAPVEEEADALPSPLASNDYTQLLARFKPIIFDTLKVVLPDKLGDGKDDPYKGVPLDSLEVKVMFPEESSSKNGESRFFAVWRFEIDDIKMGLLVRGPSHDESSSIRFLVYHKQKNRFINYGQLADSWGDGGYAETQTAWLFKTKEQEWQSFVWVKEMAEKEADKSDTTRHTAHTAPDSMEVHNRYSLLELAGFRLDTLSTNTTVLLRDFGHLVKKEGTGY
jgi:hypothetical protein